MSSNNIMSATMTLTNHPFSKLIAVSLLSLCSFGCVEPPSGTSGQEIPTPTEEMGVDMAQGEEMGPADDMGTLEDMPADMAVDMAMDMGQPLDMMPDLPPDMPPLDMTGDDMPADDMAPGMPSCVSGDDEGRLDVFTICNSNDLLVMEGATGIFQLGADITLPPDFRSLRSFSGELDGKEHTISGIVLTRAEALQKPCSGSQTVYVGGFIDEVSSSTISNITFSNVVSGESSSTPLPYSTEPGQCRLITGGIFGRLSGSTISNVSVRGLRAFSNTTYGGFVGHASGSDLTNIHVMGNGIEPVSILGNNSTGGFAYHFENGSITVASFQGLITSMANTATSERSLFLVKAEQFVLLDEIAVRGKLETTGPSRLAAGLIANMNAGAGSTLDTIIIEALIDSAATTVGGIIAYAAVPPGVNLTVRNGYVSELVATPRPMRGGEVVGGLFGDIQNMGGGALLLSNLYAHSDLQNTNATAGFDGIGCNYGKIAELPEPPNSDWLDVYPDMENQSPMNPGLRCDGRAHITPAGSTYFQDVGGSYRIRQLETDWFGALRDMNLTL